VPRNFNPTAAKQAMANGDFLLHQLLAFRRPMSTCATSRARNFHRGLHPETVLDICGQTDVDAHVLHQIRDRRVRGEGFAAIAAALNGQGYRGRNGGRWYQASVRQFYQKYELDRD
jgi:hypothetical protein